MDHVALRSRLRTVCVYVPGASGIMLFVVLCSEHCVVCFWALWLVPYFKATMMVQQPRPYVDKSSEHADSHIC